MRTLNFILLALITFLLINVSNAKENKIKRHEKKDSLIRKTKYGSVLGTNDDGVLIWYGIPYGAAPVGDLRWAAPQNPKPWRDTLNCTVPAEIALQMSSDEIVGTEDCLNLDVYSPPKAKKLPVMVYIHGGNNQTGHSKELIGNEIVIKNNCIYISINYRLGIFGFNNLPALHTKSGSSGNYALLDMAKALDWIKENVSKFGGDPKNITITGFSAGGRDVMAMLISPLFAHKFHKAIVFSGGMTIADMDDSIKRIASVLAPLAVEDKVAQNEEKAKAWLMTSKKEVKKWLYSVDSNRLVTLMGNAGIRMSVFPHLFNDGVVIPKEGFATKKWNSVPLIMVTGSTEFSFFNYGSALWSSPEGYSLGDEIPVAMNFASLYGSDMYRIFNAQISAEKMYKRYDSKIYISQVEYGSDNSGTKIDGIGSFHGVFIPMLSSTVHGYIGMANFDEAGYRALAEIFNGQIKKFLKNGNPNGSGLPKWKKWTPKKPVSMVLDATDGKASAQCKDVSISYDEIFAKMDADESLSSKGKSLVIANVLNGRWFSDPLDKHYNNPSLWN